jgi:hypothetical protein
MKEEEEEEEEARGGRAPAQCKPRQKLQQFSLRGPHFRF